MIPRIPGKRPRDLSQPLEEVEILVDADRDGLRLDVALRHYLPWRSRASVVRLIQGRQVALERGVAPRPSLRVRAGDVLRVQVPPRSAQAPPLVPDDELPILYQDRWVIVIDKPAGMAVHPAGRRLGGTLIHALHSRFRSADPEHDVVPRLLHRIDRETSGVVAVGLDEIFQGQVGRQFEDRAVSKTYLAVVHGCPEPREGLIERAIGPAFRSQVRLKLATRPDGLPASTRYRVLRQSADERFALVELKPRTGRTHQLRVHMSSLGHPLVGDKIYGLDERFFLENLRDELSAASREQLILDRHALHAQCLRFYHPFLERDLELEAPLPADMAGLVDEA